MAGPITWRSLNGPSLAEASRPMEVAQRTISGAFDNLQGVLKQREATDVQNALAQQEVMKQNLLDQIQGVKTTEGLAALEQSGELDRQRSLMSPQVRAAVRGAEEKRLGDIRTQITQGQQFNDQQKELKYRPIRDQAMSLAVQGKAKEAAAVLEANPEMPNAAELHKAIISGERDFTKFGWDKDKHDWAKNQEGRSAESHTSSLETQKLNRDASRSNIALNALRLKELQRTEREAATDREVMKTTDRLRLEYQTKMEQGQAQLGGLAAQLKLPLLSSGAPDVHNMTSEQRKLLDQGAKSLGLPSSAEIISGDTKAGQAALKQLRGMFPAEAVARAESSILGRFDTSTLGKAMGNDAANINLGIARNQVAFDEADANNWYAPGSANALRNYEELAKEVDGMFGANEREDVPHVQKYLHEVATKGIKVKDQNGKEITVVPSKNDVLGAVRSTYEGWNFFNTGRRDDIKKHIEKTLKESVTTKRIADGEESAQFRRKQAIQKLISAGK